MLKQSYVYILANKKDGALYVGMTSNLIQRIYQHKNNMFKGHTKKYAIHQLVYYEPYADIEQAIQREKQIKRWKRAWKIALIEKNNQQWKDLYHEIS